MSEKLSIEVTSEIGTLQGVIVHTPGTEVENMIPENAERALYSDILNLTVAALEHRQLKGALESVTRVFEVTDLLQEVLHNEKIKEILIRQIVKNEQVTEIEDYLLALAPETLAHQLIEGVVMKKNTLSKFLDSNRYILRPLHNFFFTRDASVSLYQDVFISHMASPVRMRESLIMEAIFNYSPHFKTRTINPLLYNNFNPNMSIEGGDMLVAREDVLLIGMGGRTNSQAIDFLIEHFKGQKKPQHIVVQELPLKPESFIHLDMVFTFLDTHQVMVYEPLILQNNRYQTIHIFIDNGKVKFIRKENNLLQTLKALDFDLEPLYCGGRRDEWFQKREQWHSGANFVAVAPGKVIGYERNIYTIDELNKQGFEVIRAKDILNKKVDPNEHNKYVITIHGSELSRGGGGARCMTMPVRRGPVNWNG